MFYIIVALAVFWFVKMLKLWIDAPTWLWQSLTPLLAFLLMLPWSDPQWEWYSPFAVAGIVSLMQLVEDLISIKTDEGILHITTRRR